MMNDPTAINPPVQKESLPWFLVGKSNREKISVDLNAFYELAGKSAEKSVVLIKNYDHLLSLSSKKDVFFIENMAKEIHYKRSGNNHINTWKLICTTKSCSEVSLRKVVVRKGIG